MASSEIAVPVARGAVTRDVVAAGQRNDEERGDTATGWSYCLWVLLRFMRSVREELAFALTGTLTAFGIFWARDSIPTALRPWTPLLVIVVWCFFFGWAVFRTWSKMAIALDNAVAAGQAKARSSLVFDPRLPDCIHREGEHITYRVGIMNVGGASENVAVRLGSADPMPQSFGGKYFLRKHDFSREFVVGGGQQGTPIDFVDVVRVYRSKDRVYLLLNHPERKEAVPIPIPGLRSVTLRLEASTAFELTISFAEGEDGWLVPRVAASADDHSPALQAEDSTPSLLRRLWALLKP